MWWTAWIVRAEPFAYNQLQLKPWEFWDLTPAEFNRLREGYYRRRRTQLEMEATWVCVLVNHYPMRGKGSRALRVEQLIGPSPFSLAKAIRERDAKLLKQGKRKP